MPNSHSKKVIWFEVEWLLLEATKLMGIQKIARDVAFCRRKPIEFYNDVELCFKPIAYIFAFVHCGNCDTQ